MTVDRTTPPAVPAAPPAPGPRAEVDRNEVFLEYTKSICPVCKVVVDAQVNARDGKVYLRKRCKEHGLFEALVYGDAQMYLDSAPDRAVQVAVGSDLDQAQAGVLLVLRAQPAVAWAAVLDFGLELQQECAC